MSTITVYDLSSTEVTKVVDVSLRRRALEGTDSDKNNNQPRGIRVYTQTTLSAVLIPNNVANALVASITSGILTSSLQQSGINANTVGVASMEVQHDDSARISIPQMLYTANATQIPRSSQYTPLSVTNLQQSNDSSSTSISLLSGASSSPFTIVSENKDDDNTTTIIIIAGAVGGLFLLLLVFCVSRRKRKFQTMGFNSATQMAVEVR